MNTIGALHQSATAVSTVLQFAKGLGADLFAVVASLVLIGAYYLHRSHRVSQDPTYTIHGINEIARTLWVESIMRTPGKEILAVQTLRNFIMGASLMASTAALLIIGTLTLSGQVENISRSWHALNVFGTHSAALWIVKVLCLLADFVLAFFAFVMAVRLANQVGFMINAEGAAAHHDLTPAGVARRLNRAGRYFSIGLRGFLFAVPLAFWLFGPIFFVAASAGLVFALRRIDRSPRAPAALNPAD